MLQLKTMIGHEGKDYGFERLFEAVQFFPQNVPLMIREEPALLECTNYAGETVLQYFSMEGVNEVVELLLSCGAQADEWSVYFACGPGHARTIDILLSAGAQPDCTSCAREIVSWGVSRVKRLSIKRVFHHHGFDLQV